MSPPASSSSSFRPPSNVKDREKSPVITEKSPINQKREVLEVFKGKKYSSSSSSTGASSSRVAGTTMKCNIFVSKTSRINLQKIVGSKGCEADGLQMNASQRLDANDVQKTIDKVQLIENFPFKSILRNGIRYLDTDSLKRDLKERTEEEFNHVLFYQHNAIKNSPAARLNARFTAWDGTNNTELVEFNKIVALCKDASHKFDIVISRTCLEDERNTFMAGCKAVVDLVDISSNSAGDDDVNDDDNNIEEDV